MTNLLEKIKNILTFPKRKLEEIGDGIGDQIAESSIFPYAEFEKLAAIPANRLTPEENKRLGRLSSQIDKTQEGIVGNLEVFTERGSQAIKDSATRIGEAAIRPYKEDLKSYSENLVNFAKKHPFLAGCIGLALILTGGLAGGLIGKIVGYFSLPFGSSLTGLAGTLVGGGLSLVLGWPLIKAAFGDTSDLEKLAGESGDKKSETNTLKKSKTTELISGSRVHADSPELSEAETKSTAATLAIVSSSNSTKFKASPTSLSGVQKTTAASVVDKSESLSQTQLSF